MVHVDERWESLKLAKAAGWTKIHDHPDIDPAHEALMVREVFTELARSKKKWPDDFAKANAEMEKAATELEAAIRAGNPAAANTAFGAGGAACKACHGEYRNTTGALK